MGVRPSEDLEEWPHRCNIRAAGEIAVLPEVSNPPYGTPDVTTAVVKLAEGIVGCAP